MSVGAFSWPVMVGSVGRECEVGFCCVEGVTVVRLRAAVASDGLSGSVLGSMYPEGVVGGEEGERGGRPGVDSDSRNLTKSWEREAICGVEQS